MIKSIPSCQCVSAVHLAIQHPYTYKHSKLNLSAPIQKKESIWIC